MINANKGLSSKEVADKFNLFGKNKIEDEKNSRLKKTVKAFLSPTALMFLVAAILSLASGKVFDFYFILFLMFLNFFVSFWQEKKADNAINELNKLLKLMVKVLRDGQWSRIDSELLVPDDVISLYVGDVIPADLELITGSNLSVNEASLTGESLPVEKGSGDTVYSGSFVVTGQALARVKATGKNTYFGKILSSLDLKPKRSMLEKDILSISKSLSILSLSAVAILTVVFFLNKLPMLDTLTLDLSLIIAGIPIAMPAVLTLIISIGVLKLSKESVVVRRLASLEELANVDLLFTDKTGTLTKNEIVIKKTIPYGVSEEEVLRFAFFASISNNNDLICKTITKKTQEQGLEIGKYGIKEFIPADSIRKRSSCLVGLGNQIVYISVGAPQIIRKFCNLDSAQKKTLEKDIKKAAKEGFRVLAVAANMDGAGEKEMRLVGLLLLSDEIRQSARHTLEFLRENGVKVKMLTGDHRAIALSVGQELGLGKEDVFSEILPADKYNLVVLGKKNHVVAVTGDGVNDLPAVKMADVGFAVSNAVSALKSSADIVLLSPGIFVITTAIIEARKIFARIHSYSVYRISESLRVIVTIFILGLLFRAYPLTPIQLILLAIFNDIPIISLAFNRVKVANKPAKIEVKKRFVISTLFGLVGIVNSMLFLFILLRLFHYDWTIISTAFFLKLTVGGHLLIFVAHTKERWYRYLPSKQVILAVIATQLLATSLTVFGIFMVRMPVPLVLFTWAWTIFWMQIGELMKILQAEYGKRFGKSDNP